MRRQYPFHLIEPKWQQVWEKQQSFRAWNPNEEIPAEHPFAQRHGLSGKIASAEALPPKFYILDMFPYPSGAGLHVGHPEGYTATDILARYRRARGFNVLHPMGWDAFGLPAEQYAIKTGQHPRKTTEENIANFKRQIKSLGFSYDWSREVDTTDPKYFKWTQWIFLKLYNSWFNPKTNKAEPIEALEYPSELQDSPPSPPSDGGEGRGEEVGSKSPLLNPLPTRSSRGEEEDRIAKRRAFRDSKRLAYIAEAPVNWCEELGTVLANEEVIDGKSEVGGFPVVRKPMRQWMLRITAYAERLLNDLDGIDWSHSLKEMQRNWIGRSEGAEVDFQVAGSPEKIRVFTTRPDTLFGATYMVLSPEHKLVDEFLRRAADHPLVNGKIKATSVTVFDVATNTTATMPLADASEQAKAKGVDLIQINSPAQSFCLLQDFGMFRYWQKKVLEQVEAVRSYRDEVAKKSDLERTELAKEKTGVFTGAYAINPVNEEKIPIWIADYVLATYGTGAIMAVPAHDERDFEFAKKFNLPIRAVVTPEDNWLFEASENVQEFFSFNVSDLLKTYLQNPAKFTTAFTTHYTVANSKNEEIGLNGLPTFEAKTKITDWLESKGLGKKTVNFKLRDWLFSRQRFWGEPFPIIWKRDTNGTLYHEALPESALPVVPPELTDYKPAPGGEPPLARAKDWVNLPDGSIRETNTMPQWAGSCWYYLRYLDAQNPQGFVGNDAEQYWMGSRGRESAPLSPSEKNAPTNVGGYEPQGVDLYVGGTEHAVLHLLYARFWHKVLFDLGYVTTPEPFFKLVNQGLILGEDGQKMSKSRGNVVNPDDIMGEFGADAFRLYEMFMGPLEMVKPWNTNGVAGVYKFLGRVWRLFVDEKSETEFEQAESTTEAQRHRELLEQIQLSAAIKNVDATSAQLKTLHACIKKVTEDLDGLRFNTAISAMMVFVNDSIAWETKPVSLLREFLILLQPFAPHLAEELWEKLNIQHPTSNAEHRIALAYANWPKFDPALLVENEVEIPIQVNGKLRDKIVIAAAATQQELETAALASDKIKPFIEGKMIKKIVIVPKKLVNIVAV